MSMRLRFRSSMLMLVMRSKLKDFRSYNLDLLFFSRSSNTPLDYDPLDSTVEMFSEENPARGPVGDEFEFNLFDEDQKEEFVTKELDHETSEEGNEHNASNAERDQSEIGESKPEGVIKKRKQESSQGMSLNV